MRDQEPNTEATELESGNDEILAEDKPVLRPKKASGKKRDREKESGSEQSDVPENLPLQSHKILDAAHLGPELISSRTRSKVCEAKDIQTELTTISIGTNTASSVFFSHAPDAVLEFPEYRKMGTTDFTWSQARELKNQRFVINAQKYGKDWWNKEKKKLNVAKRLVEGTVFAKHASIVHNHTSANATWFQSLTFSNGPKLCAMSGG